MLERAECGNDCAALNGAYAERDGANAVRGRLAERSGGALPLECGGRHRRTCYS